MSPDKAVKNIPRIISGKEGDGTNERMSLRGPYVKDPIVEDHIEDHIV